MSQSETIDKQQAVREIVRSLDDLLDKSGFERVEERQNVTSWAEDLGTDEFLTSGIGRIYEHRTNDVKFGVNFFPEQEVTSHDSVDYVELNLYLNGILKNRNCSYIGELHGSFEEVFGDEQTIKIRGDEWQKEESPIFLFGDPDVGARFDLEGFSDWYLKPIGYRESKTGYDIALERLLFGIDKWEPIAIASSINDARVVLTKLIEEDLEIVVKGKRERLDNKLDYKRVEENEDVREMIRKRNAEFQRAIKEKYSYFQSMDISKSRLDELLPRDIINHIFQNAESYRAEELQFKQVRGNLQVYMVRYQEKVNMLNGLTLEQYPISTNEKVWEEAKKVCGFFYGESRKHSKISIMLNTRKYEANKTLTKTPYGEKIIIRF